MRKYLKRKKLKMKLKFLPKNINAQMQEGDQCSVRHVFVFLLDNQIIQGTDLDKVTQSCLESNHNLS